uniref:Uncharacterized protein n=1 Tax=Amphimedon queenslandica TaxID=400682 RepID=A0A1X7UB94_AMPQE
MSFLVLSCRNWLILPTNEDKPVYLVSDSSLSVLAFLLSQEDFVAKVLMYGSASVAEEVCHLNRWDQCSLPLNAPETGLELRQLDIVSFFLRNRAPRVDKEEGRVSNCPMLLVICARRSFMHNK